MATKSKRKDGLDFEKAQRLLEEHWGAVTTEVTSKPDHEYVENKSLRDAVRESINDTSVSYRFCLPIQLLGNVAVEVTLRQRRAAQLVGNSEGRNWSKLAAQGRNRSQRIRALTQRRRGAKEEQVISNR